MKDVYGRYRKFNEMVMSKFLYGSPLLQIYVVEVCPSLHKKKYLGLQKLPFKKYVTILHYYLGGDFFSFLCSKCSTIPAHNYY